MSYKGEIKINGKAYKVEVVNGNRYVEGIPAEEWIKKLDATTRAELAVVGQQAIVDEKKGTKNNSYQRMMDRFHIKKSN